MSGFSANDGFQFIALFAGRLPRVLLIYISPFFLRKCIALPVIIIIVNSKRGLEVASVQLLLSFLTCNPNEKSITPEEGGTLKIVSSHIRKKYGSFVQYLCPG